MPRPGSPPNPAVTVRLEPIAADLARVEAELHESVKVSDPFLEEVSAHLIGAGGSGIRPTLALCAAYAVAAGRPVRGRRIHRRGVGASLVHLGSLYHDDVIDEAETRRGVPSVNARWSNIVAILAGDFLLARASSLAASLGADVAAAPRGDDRRALPRAGARAPASLRRRPLGRGLPLRDRGQDRRRCSRRRATSAAWCRGSPTPRSTRSRASAVISGCASRSSTTCSTSPPPRTASGSPPAKTCSKASTRCPSSTRCAIPRHCANLLGQPIDGVQLAEAPASSPARTAPSTSRSRRTRATR